MMTDERIAHNCECFKKQMARFIDFSEGRALLVNNGDWLRQLNYIDLLREVGAHFSVNRMLATECYKQRWEQGLTFLEFNYMVIQAYDFSILFSLSIHHLAILRYCIISSSLFLILRASSSSIWSYPNRCSTLWVNKYTISLSKE